MKAKKLLYIAMAMLATVVALSSCKKDNGGSSTSPEDTLKAKMVGTWKCITASDPDTFVYIFDKDGEMRQAFADDPDECFKYAYSIKGTELTLSRKDAELVTTYNVSFEGANLKLVASGSTISISPTYSLAGTYQKM